MNAPMAPTPAATALPASALPCPVAAGRADEGTREASFATMLGDARAHDAGNEGADADAPREPAARAAKPRATSQATQKPQQPFHDRAAAATPQGGCGATALPAGQEAAMVAGELPADPAAEAPAAAEAAPPPLADLLPGWTPPALARAEAIGQQTTQDDAQASPLAGAAIAGASAPRAGGARIEQAPASSVDIAQAANADRPAHAGADNAALDSAVPRKAATSDAVLRRGAEADRLAAVTQGASPAAALAVATASPQPAASAASVVHAHVSPPLGSAMFAPALATQVRWLVGEGISQAQIQLNPAEMGPVSVRIVVDGREARIDFGADVAATRQVLESSLPVLAAALDDSGLKLAGGSVSDGQAGSQHAPDAHRQGSARATARGAIVVEGDATPTAAAGRPAARGLVDLVA